jgi:hypothetical protein
MCLPPAIEEGSCHRGTQLVNSREISGIEVGSSVEVTDAVQWGLMLEQNKD